MRNKKRFSNLMVGGCGHLCLVAVVCDLCRLVVVGCGFVEVAG